MPRTGSTLARTLDRLSAELDGASLAESSSFSPLVVELERVLPAVPARIPALADLLRVCLHGLRALRDGTAVDASGRRGAVRDALAAARRCLTMRNRAARDAAIDNAGRALFLAAGWDPAGWGAGAMRNDGTPGAATRAPMSLDDAALLLMQVDPADAHEIGRLHRAFEQLASDQSYPPVARKHLAAAARGLAESSERGADPSRAVASASDALEAAMQAMHDGTGADEEHPASAAASTAPQTRDDARIAPDAARSIAPEAIQSDALPPDADLGLLREFVVESREYIEDAEAALLILETDPANADAIDTVFRALHTIKGTAAFLGLERLTALAHHAESLLDRIRRREIQCTGGYADLALLSVDVVKAMLESVEAALAGAPMIVPDGYDALLRLLAAPEAAGVSGARSELTRDALRVGGLSVSARAAERDATRGLMPRDASVRVRTNRLDRLIDLVGELVIAQSMIVQDEVVRHGGYHGLARKVGHAGKLVRELHDLSMSLRMVPLRGLFQKLNRLVRDLAQKTGKQVELVIEGEETEIDRHMVAVIADPLVHMVRNAVDHGIELPDRRAASGKARTGTLRIAAHHAGGNVVVELEDDGQGLDPDRIARKALALGLVDADRTLTPTEAYELIFAPGFSTAEAVTDVSGRGVGLDVVRRNIEALRGRIEIDSERGRGTRFSLRLPLTLAITDGMLVRVGEERYIVPTVHIHMSFRPERGMLSTVAGRGELVMLRGDALPIVRLHRVFGVPSPVTDPTHGLLMIVGDGERRSALLVDELLGQQQVVAKPLGDGVGAVPGISGGAILGDGRVGLILDVGAIVNLARRSPSPRRDAAPAAARSVA